MTLVLSRYACLRREGNQLVAEGRRADIRVVLDDDRISRLLQLMVTPQPVRDAAAQVGLGQEEAEELVGRLMATGILVGPEAAAREDASVWAFDDVRFHERSRHRPLGPFPPPGAPSPPPAIPLRRWPLSLALPRPDLDALERDDPPLAAVQAARRSVREPGRDPMSLPQIAEFLFRVGRVEDLWRRGEMTFAPRPYPGAGALYELELYVVANDCEGLDPGVYYYAPDHHGMALAPGPVEASVELLGAAAADMGAEHMPQALIVIAARFPRIASKYGPLAYSLMLKNVGVVLQTMYLVATAMGLGACAIGAGDAGVFARATGLDPEHETSVGELCLVTRSSI